MSISLAITVMRDVLATEPLRLSIPFRKGQLVELDKITLIDQELDTLPLKLTALERWADKSIRWLLIDTLLHDQITSNSTLILSNSTQSKTPENHLLTTETNNTITIDTGPFKLSLDKHQLTPTITNNETTQTNHLTSSITLRDKNNNEFTPQVTAIKHAIGQHDVTTHIEAHGKFSIPTSDFEADFASRFDFYAGTSIVKWQFTLHNPAAAKHRGGLWDLGDDASLLFKDLSINFNISAIDQIQLSLNENQSPITSQFDSNNGSSPRLSLHQHSSGGENWNSRNHINASEKLSVQVRGYELSDSNNEYKGNRANPIIQVQNNDLTLATHIENFWQNFPKAIKENNNSISLSLFPELDNQLHELQGGEKKTHTLFLDFNDTPEVLNWARQPSRATVSSEHYAATNTIPLLSDSMTDDSFKTLIDQGIKGPDNFFNKREKIDEYGWRHFGDIYADHETLYQTEDATPLSSHYNNQYDPIYGFARQYIETGNPQWFQLMDDLAKHVTDIDIYHTDRDREEYNHGLFWHTDHYLDAGTCSHRTFSKKHLEVDHVAQSGGGPGTEHCYTTGLRYHYYLTGHPPSKQAVIELTTWMTYAQEGTGSLLERIQAIRTKDIPRLKRLQKGEKIACFQYPLTRGTGNYISTLLDAYYLTDNNKLIEQIESIIRETIHPNDDIADRNLTDIEMTWSYTIFLQAIAKYLHYKADHQEFDNNYLYARDSLLHYANWIADNEQPYLENSDVLEYPNHTWTAQDIRKACVLMDAYYFAPQNTQHYKERANHFSHYVANTLKDESTRSFSRILAILMQNSVPSSKTKPLAKTIKDAGINIKNHGPAPLLTTRKLATKIILDLIKLSFKFSIKRELKWLKNRLK